VTEQCFDPFTSTLDEAKERPDPRAAMRCVRGAQILLSKREYFVASPLEGMAICAKFGLIAPSWLSEPFLRGIEAVLTHEARGWDDAFGAPRAKSYKQPQARRRHVLTDRVCKLFIESINRNPAIPIDKAHLWEPIAMELNSSATVVEEIYREALRRGQVMSGEEVRQLATVKAGEPRIVFGAGLSVAGIKSRASSQPAQQAPRAGVRRKP